MRANTTEAKYNQRTNICDAASENTAAKINIDLNAVLSNNSVAAVLDPAVIKHAMARANSVRSSRFNNRPLRPEKLVHANSCCEAARQSNHFGMIAMAQQTTPPASIAPAWASLILRLTIARPKPIVVEENSRIVRAADHNSRRVAT